VAATTAAPSTRATSTTATSNGTASSASIAVSAAIGRFVHAHAIRSLATANPRHANRAMMAAQWRGGIGGDFV